MQTSFFSHEWALNDSGAMVTAQIGAGGTFRVVDATHVTLVLASVPADAVCCYRYDNGPWQAAQPTVGAWKISTPSPAQHDCEWFFQQTTAKAPVLWVEPLTVSALTSDGALAPLPDHEPTLLFVGDSITAGAQMAADGHHPEVAYPQLVGDALGYRVERIAFGGTGLTPQAPMRTPDPITALWYAADDVPRHIPAYAQIIVNYGTNDGNHGADRQRFAFNLRVYLLELVKRFHQTPVLLLVPVNQAFADVFAVEAARFAHMTVIETRDWLPELTQVHPTTRDHARIATCLVDKIAPADR